MHGTVYATQAFARLLLKTNSPGVVVNISSESGQHGSTGQSIYAASKAAIDSLTRSWAKELSGSGIRVVSVAPGVLEVTGLRTAEYEEKLAYSRGQTVQQLRETYTANIPLHREARLQEVRVQALLPSVQR